MRRWFLVSLFLVFALVATGCNKEVQPEDRFTEYVKLWNDQKFDKMYDYLSEEAKGKISKEDFTNRYTKIYKDLEIEDAKVTFKKPAEATDKKAKKAELPFTSSMNSVAGKIAFDHEAVLVKEERDKEANWYIDWDTTYIFPDLKEGAKISLPATRAKRGDILDKNGEGLAVTGTAIEIGLVPKNMEGQEEEVLQKLSDLLGLTTEQIQKELSAPWVKPDLFVPIKKIPMDDTDLLSQLTTIAAVQTREVSARVYPLGEAAAHLIGYVGPITADEIEKNAGKGYQSSDVIGKRGLEQVLEEKLKGEHGVKIVIKQTDETETVIAEKKVKNGEDVQLSIDASLQTKIFNEMGGSPGTAAAMNPVTGETLALVSSPSFNPNLLSLGATKKQWTELEENKDAPLLNRFKSTYAPGSVMKPITAAIALNEGAADWEKTRNIEGLTWKKDSSWGGYQVVRVTDPNTPVNLEKALLYSDNIYFAQTALELGKDKFVSGLKSFGFEDPIPSYLYPVEASKIGKMDTEVALADSSYGQGQIEMSILHLAAAYTPFTNSGNLIKPILLAGEEHGQVWKEKIVNEENAAKMNQALLNVVEDPSGTGHAGKIEGYPIAGKTGTAEYKEKQGDKGKENGLFVAYNTDNPEILVALMVEGVENSGGSKVAVEKVKRILQP